MNNMVFLHRIPERFLKMSKQFILSAYGSNNKPKIITWNNGTGGVLLVVRDVISDRNHRNGEAFAVHAA